MLAAIQRRLSSAPTQAWPALALAVLAVLPSLWAPFSLDDVVAVEQSACVTGAFDPVRIVRSNFWCEAGALRSIESWRPLPVFVWWLLFRLGAGALPFHALNLGLHVACTWQVFRLGRDLELGARVPTIGACIFASLAIHVDAVAPAVGAGGLFAALLVLACVRAFWVGHWRFIAYGAAAVLAKESGVLALALVGAVLVFAHDPKRLGSRRNAILGVLALALATFGILALRADVLGGWTGAHIPWHVNALVDASAAERGISGLAIVGHYHLLTLAGGPMSADYAFAALGVGRELSVLDVVIGAAGLLGWIWLGWRRRHDTSIRLLVVWILGTCLFVSNIPFLLPAVFAERLFYLPSVAIALLAGRGIAHALENARIRRTLVFGLLGLVLGVQTIRSLAHAWAFGDRSRILNTTVEATPDNARARMWLASALLREGDAEGARIHAEAAAEIRPEWGAPIAVLAVLEDMEGRPERALAGFRKAMELDPQDGEIADLFIQFLLRYGHREPARAVYQAHASARGTADPQVTVP